MKYRTLVADPPWPGDWFPFAPGGRRANCTLPEYALMSLSDIQALPVSTWADTDAHLFLWVPARLNREGVGVATARVWGFEPVSEIVWEKPNPGNGIFPRHCHELLLVCRRGDLPFSGPRNVRSVQKWRQRYDKNGGKRHSAKPEAALDLIEQASPGPYLELWSRRHRLGWDVWGDDSANTAEVPA